MHAVVNHLPIKEGADWTALAAKLDKFAMEMQATHPGFVKAFVVRASETEAILVGLYADEEALVRLSRDVAAPWFAENIRPFLAGPVARSTGVVVAGVV